MTVKNSENRSRIFVSDKDSGSDLEEWPSYVHRKQKAGSKTAEIWTKQMTKKESIAIVM